MWMKYVKLESFQNLAMAEMIESYLNERGIPAQLEIQRRAEPAGFVHQRSDLLVPFHEAEQARAMVQRLVDKKRPFEVRCGQCCQPKRSIMSLCSSCGADGFFSSRAHAVN